MLVPAIRSMGMPCSSNTLMAPMCASPPGAATAQRQADLWSYRFFGSQFGEYLGGRFARNGPFSKGAAIITQEGVRHGKSSLNAECGCPDSGGRIQTAL